MCLKPIGVILGVKTSSQMRISRSANSCDENNATPTVISPAIWLKEIKMHSLNSKCTEMLSLIENVLLILLNVPLNYLSKISGTL